MAAYGRPYGAGLSISGYVGEAVLLSIPGIIMLFLSRSGLAMRPGDVGLVAMFASPLLLNGILGARRGPTFMILLTLFLCSSVLRSRRPRPTHRTARPPGPLRSVVHSSKASLVGLRPRPAAAGKLRCAVGLPGDSITVREIGKLSSG